MTVYLPDVKTKPKPEYIILVTVKMAQRTMLVWDGN